jgi:hypothetical protein
MVASIAILWLGVAFVGIAWTLGVHRASQGRMTLGAAILFCSLVGLHLTLALTGIASDFTRFPPPVLPFFLFNIAIAVYISRSRFGDALVSRLSFSALIGFHSFRILAELLLITGLREGLTPPQMTFEGHNFDIVTGVTAIPMACYAAKRVRPGLIASWNVMGVAFLVVIAFVAITSMPVPFRLYEGETSNIWVTTSPYILLPGILVTAAISGHLLIFRKLAGSWRISRNNEDAR